MTRRRPQVQIPALSDDHQHGEQAERFRERLLREAQALAKLSHPNVIAVYDVGAIGAHVFIATEFVDGQTLRRWLKERSRTPREILDVFLAAGEGLMAAHRAGLVHRDFKPDNVMVGRDGRVRVLDFGLVRAAGLDTRADEQVAPPPSVGSDPEDEHPPTAEERPSAKQGGGNTGTNAPPRTPPGPPGPPAPPALAVSGALSELSSSSDRLMTPLTQMGSVMGTPRYMAPEQHLGEAADERADQFSFCLSLHEALYGEMPFAESATGEVTVPVLEGRIIEPPSGARVPRWLRQVLLRGLAIAPTARHPSMSALLSALRADPRVARRQWLRTAGVLGSLLVILLIWRVQVRHQVRACQGAEHKLAGVWDDPLRAAVRARFRASGKPFAEMVLRTVEHAFDKYASAWVGMRIETCEATHVRGEQSQELLDLRMACLDDRLTQLKTLADLYATGDDSVVEHAAQSAQSLPGLDLCADAVALRAPIQPPREPERRRRIEAVRQQIARAHALGLAARYDDGIRLTRGALAEAVALQYPPAEAEAELRLGQLFGDQGNYAESARALHRSYVAAIAGHHDEAAAWAATDLIQALGERQAHYEDAERWAEIAEACIRRLSHRDELLGMLFTYRSMLREREGKYDQALRDGTGALELEQRVLGSDHYSVATIYYNLGNIYYELAQYAEALDSYRRAHDIGERILGSDHPMLAKTLRGMADVYGTTGEHERAIALYEQVLAGLGRLQPDHPTVPLVYNNMGDELQVIGKPREAFEHYQRALEAWQKRLGPSYETTLALHNMGEAKLALNQPDEALQYLKRADETCERALGPSHAMCGINLRYIGEAYRRLDKPDEALRHLRRSIAVIENALGAKHPQLAQALLGLGRLELGRQRAASALVPLERALVIAEAQPKQDFALAEIRFALAQALWQSGDRTRAVNLASHARDGSRAAGAVGRRLATETAAWLAGHS